MSATPGPDEVAGQAVMTAIRHNLTQLEDTFELARIGLRQSSELKRTVSLCLTLQLSKASSVYSQCVYPGANGVPLSNSLKSPLCTPSVYTLKRTVCFSLKPSGVRPLHVRSTCKAHLLRQRQGSNRAQQFVPTLHVPSLYASPSMCPLYVSRCVSPLCLHYARTHTHTRSLSHTQTQTQVEALREAEGALEQARILKSQILWWFHILDVLPDS